MSDLEKAKQLLNGHSIVLVKNEEVIIDDGKGISPMMKFIGENINLEGFSAADIVIGKAAAMLFTKAKIKAVYGNIMSIDAKNYLSNHNIECNYNQLVDNIINRMGTDICPMEKTVKDIDDYEVGYIALKQKIQEMRK